MKKLIWIFLGLTFHSNCQTPGNGVTDVDGNQYNSVIIGTQEWMKENLNVSKYSDGTPIPQVTDSNAWANLTTGAWCYYNNDPANGAVYGKIYNWYAVNDPRGLAPSGYHIPSDTEWITLINFLDPLATGSSGTTSNMSNISGGKMKSTGTTLWTSPNTGATNISEFSALPGGSASTALTFTSIGIGGCWWSSSAYSIGTTDARGFVLSHNTSVAFRTIAPKKIGFSVRCLNNNILDNTTFNINKIMLQPNPAVSFLNIKTDISHINQSYTIIDGLGRIVLSGKLNEVDTNINVDQLSKGIYYIKIADNIANKFIKE